MPEPLPVNTRLDGYTLLATVGAGAFGITYLASEKFLNRRVIIKEHAPAELCERNERTGELQPLLTDEYAQSLRAFHREAEILSRLNIEGVVRIHRILHALNTAYIVMEYVDGVSPAEWIPAHSPREVMQLQVQLLQTLSKLHSAGVIHRDIKPDNIIILPSGQPVLIDFGTALSNTTISPLLRTGTSSYSAPEQLVDEGNVGPWSDLYALARTFLTLLPENKNKLYPRAFLRSSERAAQMDINARYAYAADWLKDLRPVVRVGRLVAVVLCVAVACAGAWVLVSALRPARTAPILTEESGANTQSGVKFRTIGHALPVRHFPEGSPYHKVTKQMDALCEEMKSDVDNARRAEILRELSRLSAERWRIATEAAYRNPK